MRCWVSGQRLSSVSVVVQWSLHTRPSDDDANRRLGQPQRFLYFYYVFAAGKDVVRWTTEHEHEVVAAATVDNVVECVVAHNN